MADHITVDGANLTLRPLVDVARRNRPIRITDNETVLGKIQASCDFVQSAVSSGEPVYGVTTSVGANANYIIPESEVDALQNNTLWFLKVGAGKPLPTSSVRAAMLLRLNSLMRGVSGIRLELLRRIETFLNEGVTPHMLEYGSIGASGDLVPLSYLAGSIVGDATGHTVDFAGETMLATTALKRLGMGHLPLKAKEGLAIINGTAVMTGMASLCLHDTRVLTALSLGSHALFTQAFCASEQAFHPFIQQHKPHTGQIAAADNMRKWLVGSKMTAEGLKGHYEHQAPDLIQDRYSLRCLPQYMAPIIDGLNYIEDQLVVEINSATDNPLFDVDNKAIYNCGNFLGEHVAVSMDQLRHYIGLLGMHLDAQIAMLVAPEFSNGLPQSLIGNEERQVNTGLKTLQILGNSLVPILTFLGNSISDRYLTHAEQFNQNINSQGFAAANLARQSVDTFQHYMAVPLMMGIQAADLRTKSLAGHFDARECLSPASAALYQAVLGVVGVKPSAKTPYVFNDNDLERDKHITAIYDDIVSEGKIIGALGEILDD